MRTLPLLALLTLTALAAGCPPAQPQSGKPASGTSASAPPAAKPLVSICLVRSDLGLGDGWFARDADSALAELAQAGRITYLVAGPLPQPLELEAGAGDVGLPRAGSGKPGSMTAKEAAALLDQAQACDWLALTSPLLLTPALDRIGQGKLKAKAVLLLDEEGLGELPKAPPAPVYVVRYDIKHMAFLCGVAAAVSANNAHFIALGNSSDPQAAEFLKAAEAGAKYQSNGAITFSGIVPVDESGVVTQEALRTTLGSVMAQGGEHFQCTNFIIAVGRATPSVLNALSRKPTNGYIAAGYADYTAVRPSRVLGCALKEPGAALKYIVGQLGQGKTLASLVLDGRINVGLSENAIGYSSLEQYKNYNPDGADIQQAVQYAEGLVRAGEIDYAY